MLGTIKQAEQSPTSVQSTLPILGSPTAGQSFPAPTTTTPQPTHSLSTGAIAGIAVGGGAALGLTVAAIYLLLRRRREKGNAEKLSSAPSTTESGRETGNGVGTEAETMSRMDKKEGRDGVDTGSHDRVDSLGELNSPHGVSELGQGWRVPEMSGPHGLSELPAKRHV